MNFFAATFRGVRAIIRSFWPILLIVGGPYLYGAWRDYGKQPIHFGAVAGFGDSTPNFIRASYRPKNNGPQSLILDDGISKDFFNYWRTLAVREFPLSNSSNFDVWEELNQQDYLKRMRKLDAEMPTSCRQQVMTCPADSPFITKTEELLKQYHISSHLALWQLQRMRAYYVAALTNKNVRSAVLNWDALSDQNKIALAYRLSAYEFAAYGYNPSQINLQIRKSKFSRTQDAAHAVEPADGDRQKRYAIEYNESHFESLSASGFFDATTHETRHLIESLLRSLFQSQQGRAYLASENILTEMEISRTNYPRLDMVSEKNGDFEEAYIHQHEEAVAFFNGSVGGLLAYRIKKLDPSLVITAQRAQEMFFEDIFGGPAFQTFIISRVLPDLLLQQWKAGGEICTGSALLAREHCYAAPERGLQSANPGRSILAKIRDLDVR